MKNNVRCNKWLIFPVSIILIVFIVMIGNRVITSVIEKKIGQALRQVSPKIHADYTSIHANLFRSSASINDLNICFIPYKNEAKYQHLFHFKSVTLSGINFFKAIFNNTLSVKDVRFNKSEVKFDQFLLDKKDSGQAIIDSLHIPFKKMVITNLDIKETNVWLHSPAANQLLLKGNVALHRVEINSTKKQAETHGFKIKDVEAYLSDINYTIPHEPYIIRIKKLVLNSKEQRFIVDSVKVIPQNKIESHSNKANNKGIFEANIASIDVTKFNLQQLFAGLRSDKDLPKEDPATASLTDVHVHLVQHTNGHLFHSFSCKHLISDGIDFVKAILYDSIFVNSISLEKCGIKLNRTLIKLNRTLIDKDVLSNGNILSQLNIPFKNFSVNNFSVSGASIWLHSAKQEQQLLKGSLTVNKAILNRGSNNDSGGFDFAAITCDLSDIHYPLPDGSCFMNINRVIADSRKEMLRINSLKIVPRYDKYELGKRYGHQEDWINANVREIEILKLDFQEMLHKKFKADKITFNNCKIYVFRDRRLPRQLKQRPMLNDYLKRIPLEVRVNHLQLNNGNVIYEELPKNGAQSGTLQFSNMNLSMTPVLNHPRKNDPAYSDTYVQGAIMNSGSIKATIRAPLERNIYNVKGTIKNLDLSRLNSSAENLGQFHIQSGILNKLNFQFTATGKKASGRIIGEYHNLIIEKLKIKKGEKKVAKVPTFFLKHLIIPKNKDKSLEVAKRTGKIDYKRDPTRMITFFFLKSLLSGIRSSFKFGFLLPK